MRNFKDLCNSVEYHGERGIYFVDKDMVESEIRSSLAKNIISRV